jgi:hypothetical protein
MGVRGKFVVSGIYTSAETKLYMEPPFSVKLSEMELFPHSHVTDLWFRRRSACAYGKNSLNIQTNRFSCFY